MMYCWGVTRARYVFYAYTFIITRLFRFDLICVLNVLNGFIFFFTAKIAGLFERETRL